jgi:hypothetical protein
MRELLLGVLFVIFAVGVSLGGLRLLWALVVWFDDARLSPDLCYEVTRDFGQTQGNSAPLGAPI